LGAKQVGSGASFLQCFQLLLDAVEGALRGCQVAHEQAPLPGVGLGGEDGGERGVVVQRGVGGHEVGRGFGEERGFGAADAAEAPRGFGELVGKVAFLVVGGVAGGEGGCEELFPVGDAFAGETRSFAVMPWVTALVRTISLPAVVTGPVAVVSVFMPPFSGGWVVGVLVGLAMLLMSCGMFVEDWRRVRFCRGGQRALTIRADFYANGVQVAAFIRADFDGIGSTAREHLVGESRIHRCRRST
jgi:hypothetical protein